MVGVAAQEVEELVARQRTLIASKTTLARSLTQARQEMEMELLQTQQDTDSLNDQIKAAEATVATLQTELEALEEAVEEAKEAFDVAARVEKARRQEIDGCEAELKKLAKARDAAKKVRLNRFLRVLALHVIHTTS